MKTDVSSAAEVQALVEKTVTEFGHLDTAFNNAGIDGEWVPIAQQSEENWDSTIDINLKGTFLCLKYEILQMMKQGTGGAIVNMASIAGHIGAAGAGAYCGSKHGVMGLTKTAALETARSGIRVNSVCPAVVETAMAERLFGAPEVNKRVLDQHSIGRFGKTSEISEAVLWMVSERASFMIVQSIYVGRWISGWPESARLGRTFHEWRRFR